MSAPSRSRRSTSSLMARKLVARGLATGRFIDRTTMRKNGQSRKAVPMPASLAKFFRPL